MKNSISASKRNRPAAALAPGQRQRVPTPAMVDEVPYFLDMLEATVTLGEGVEMTYLDEKIWDFASSIRADMLSRIINRIDLVGLEFRDGLGKPVGTIRAVTEPSDGETSSSNIWICFGKKAINFDDFMFRLNRRLHYLCLPNCNNYGDRAMVEAFRAKLEAWGIFPQDRKMRRPPNGIFYEPEP
jgi:hypothetical protein